MTDLLPLGLTLPQPGLILTDLLLTQGKRRSFTAPTQQMKKCAAFRLLGSWLLGEVAQGLAPVGVRR